VSVPGSYWVLPGRLLAGEYPAQRLDALLALGIDLFLDLTWPGELAPYEPELANPYRAGAAAPRYERRPIRDHELPADAEQMRGILELVDEALARGERVYVHCRAGVGRTGLVVGCFLARRAGSGERALAELDALWEAGGRRAAWPRSPETDAQHAFVRDWSETARALPLAEPVEATTERLQDRYRGLLLGLAVGDALGMPVLHRRAGSFTPVADLLGGGPYDLPRGAWTDLTAQSLALAQGLIEDGQFDAREAVRRLTRWQREGEPSSTGHCVGISATTARALAQAQWSGQPFAGSHDPARAEAEPLARAGVAAAFAPAEPALAVELAVDFARLTHQAPLALDATRAYAALLAAALGGEGREALFARELDTLPGIAGPRPLKPEVSALVARGQGGARRPGSARAVDALALTLWAVGRHGSFKEAVLAVVNLGGDANTHGALAGQLAGALYGARAIPTAWRAALSQRELLERSADRLLERALGRLA
jgi:ADP-ribosylglycohydrolase